MHITSLPGEYGIGGFGDEAVGFAKILKEAGFTYWQVLPFTNPGSGDSPYQSDSAFAGSPLLIDPRQLFEAGLLSCEEKDACRYSGSPYAVDYAFVRENRMTMLRQAYSRLDEKKFICVYEFAGANPWLKDVALYQAIKSTEGDKAWWDWSDSFLSAHDEDALAIFEERHRDLFWFYCFIQYVFYTQWTELKREINDIGIKIIGDIPIYVSADSSDVWANRSLFLTDEKGRFSQVAGVPPDYFAKDGQLWGNPIYDWDEHERTGYSWWIARLKQNFLHYDLLRIDHFRAFSSYYSIPADAKTAREGEWKQGPGMKLFNKIGEVFKDAPIFAEDLGEMTPELEAFLEETGFATMRVLQFGFNPYDDSKHLPHNYPKNCVAYTGTHDNNTILGWLWEASETDRNFALKYCRFDGKNWGEGGPSGLSLHALITSVWSSAASLAVVPVQDLLGYGADTRMNTPGTPTGNWRVRFGTEGLKQINIAWLKELNTIYKRCQQ